MNLIKLQCPECGAALEVGTEKDFFFCTYCGTKLMIPQKAVRYEIVTRDETEIEVAKQESRTKTTQTVGATVETVVSVGLKALKMICVVLLALFALLMVLALML